MRCACTQKHFMIMFGRRSSGSPAPEIISVQYHTAIHPCTTDYDSVVLAPQAMYVGRHGKENHQNRTNALRMIQLYSRRFHLCGNLEMM